MRATPLLPLLALPLLATPALAGDLRIEFDGTVTQAVGLQGPFAGAQVGDPFRLTLDVLVSGPPVGGQMVYEVDLATSSLRVGTAYDALVPFLPSGSDPELIVEDDALFGDRLATSFGTLNSGLAMNVSLIAPLEGLFDSAYLPHLSGHYVCDVLVAQDLVGGVNGILGLEVETFDVGGLAGIQPGVTACSGQPNSTGSAASLTAFGSNTLVDDHLTLRADGLPANRPTLFLSGLVPGTMPNVGGGQGTLCLGLPFGRILHPGPLPFSTVGGVAHQTLDLARLPMGPSTMAVVPGQTWYFQCWYRDANPGSTSNLSEAISVTFL